MYCISSLVIFANHLVNTMQGIHCLSLQVDRLKICHILNQDRMEIDMIQL